MLLLLFYFTRCVFPFSLLLTRLPRGRSSCHSHSLGHKHLSEPVVQLQVEEMKGQALRGGRPPHTRGLAASPATLQGSRGDMDGRQPSLHGLMQAQVQQGGCLCLSFAPVTGTVIASGAGACSENLAESMEFCTDAARMLSVYVKCVPLCHGSALPHPRYHSF